MKDKSILVLNAGSSSLKFSVFQPRNASDLDLLLHGSVDGLGGPAARISASDGDGKSLVDRPVKPGELKSPNGGIQVVGPWLRDHLRGQPPIGAVGHRVVHGGTKFSQPVLIDGSVLTDLEALIPLAPLHQPHNLAAIRAVREWQPEIPQVACFDTAFHRSHPQLADLYALPWDFYEAGVRRYGFHGLSYEYIASALPQIAPELATGRVIVAHLGNGASLCAMHSGRSVDSTMGFSALDGVPMGTRPGELDPGVLLYLVGKRRMTAEQLEQLLYRESGLLGLSGVSNDMRVLCESSEPRARIAIDYFVWRVAKEIGGLAASLGGLDALVFTAGIGENSLSIRARIVAACAWLGAKLDDEANAANAPRISTADSKLSIFVVPTNEELMIARHTMALVDAVSPARESTSPIS